MAKLYLFITGLIIWLITIVILINNLLIRVIIDFKDISNLYALLFCICIGYIAMRVIIKEISNTISKIHYYRTKECYPDLVSKIDQDIEEILQQRRSK